MNYLSEVNINALFDELVSEGVIVYSPHKVMQVDADGYPLEFRICPSLAKKPHTVGAQLDPSFDKSQKWGPGSDMYCPDERLKITKLNGTHDLALNLFCVDRPQYICLTLDSYRRQEEPLDVNDCEAALAMLRSLDSMYVIYNCSEQAGCSRSHKHLQALRGPPAGFEYFVQEDKRDAIPFKFNLHHFASGFSAMSASELLDVYNVLLAQQRKTLRVSETELCPHNVVLWKNRMIVIPRRKSGIERAATNAAGMVGSVWVPDASYVGDWKRLGPRKVLQEFGVPR